MTEVNQKKSSKFLTTKMIRVVNFLGAILFAGTMFKDGLQIFAVYFAMYYYLWLYVIFLVFEIRYYNLTQTKLQNYLLKHPLATIGGILPILVVLVQRI
jgi:hypothetical protein